MEQILNARTFAVWSRNFRYFKRAWLVSLFWAVVEPLVYFFSVGWGVGQFIGQVEGVSYAAFFCPSLVCSSAMIVAYMETTYGSYTKMTYQKTFSTILLSPVSSAQIARGEILWGATKGMLSAVVITAVGYGFGLVSSPVALIGLGFAFVTAWVFAALGLLVSTFAKTYDSFVYSISGFIVPMSLFSATYFPLSGLPEWLRPFAYLLPLTHAVLPTRDLFLGRLAPLHVLHFLVLFVLGVTLNQWATRRLTNRILS